MRRIAAERTLFWVLFVAICLLYVLPLWAASYLPMLDLPMHAQLAAIFRAARDPSTNMAHAYVVRGGIVPYLTFYVLVDLLACILSITTSIKVVLTLIALGIPAALLLVLRGFGRSRWLVFLAFPLIYDVNATYGYISFRMSIALVVAALGLLRLELSAPRLWRALLLGALGALVFFTHAHGFVILVPLWLLLVLLASPRLSLAARAIAALLPGLALSTVWFVPALSAKGPGGPRTIFLPLIKLLELAPHRLLNSFSSSIDEIVVIGMALLWGALIVTSPAKGAAVQPGWRALLAAHFLEIAAALLLIAYVFFPNQIHTSTQELYGLNYRFLLPLSLVAIAIPRVDLGRWRVVALAPALIFSTWFGLYVLAEYRAFDAKYRVFDRIIEAIPPRRRVLPFNYLTWDERFTLPLLGHFVGYYCARKDGLTSSDHSATRYQYIPVKQRDPQALPAATYPGPLRMDVFAPRYDYFLVADRPGSQQAPFDLRAMRLVAAAGPWRLYEPLRTDPPPAR